MASQCLIEDEESILSSPRIQIIHKHPANAHRIRSDLDLQELVIESYPLKLADKIIPFLDQVPLQWYSLQQTSSSQTHSMTRSPQRRSRTASVTDTESFLSQTSTSVNSIDSMVPQTSTILPPPCSRGLALTPERQILPPSQSTSSAFTPRTITPGGTLFSPLKDYHDKITPLPSGFTSRPSRGSPSVPYVFFSPPRQSFVDQVYSQPAPPTRGRGRGRRCRGTARGTGTTMTDMIAHTVHASRPLVQFDPTPRSIEYSWPKPTLILRHDVSTQALRDMFVWSWKCVAEGRIIGLEETGMIFFHDRTRVLEIREVCALLNMARLRNACDVLLTRWDGSKLD